MDIGASFKIAAAVAGQQSIDRLNSSLKQTQDAASLVKRGFDQLNLSQDKLTSFAKSAALGLAGIGAGIGLSVLKEKFDGVVEGLVRIKEAAEKTGAAGDKIGAIFQVAKITGDSFDTIETGIIKLDKALAGADDTAKGAAKALDAIGLSTQSLRAMDPADAFKKIAEQLAKFEDGAGKTAVAIDIFGKNGAALLPFMKDYAELSNVVSKSTEEQRQQADQYEKSLRLLTATKNELYKVISVALLPVANAFVQMLIETNKETQGVRGAVKGLAEDGTLTAVFKEAARAGAAFLDVLSVIARAVAQVGSSLAVVVNDVVKTAEIAVKAPTALFRNGGIEELASLWRQRSQFAQAANDDMAKRWGSGLTPYTDKLENQFIKNATPIAKEARSDALKGYQSRTPTQQREGPDPYTVEMQNLGREAAKDAFMVSHIDQYADKITSAKAAQIQFDVEFGKFKDLTTAQKKNLLEAANLVDTNAEKLRQAKEGLSYEKDTRSIEAQTRALGQSNLQKKITVALQDLENKGIKQGSELYDRLAQSRVDALTKAADAERSWVVGAKDGFNEYLDAVNNMAKTTKDLMSNAFKGMEDALVEFTMTGKLNFSSMATSIIKDLIRIQIQQSIMKPLTGLLSSAFGSMFGGGFGGALGGAAGGSSIYSLSGGGIGGLGLKASFDGGGYTGSSARSGGMDGKGGFLAMMHPQETVIDHTKGQGSSGSGVVVNVTVNADTGQTQGGDASSLGKLGSAIGAAVRSEIIQQRRPGGLLAA